jgi:hypothetical protein
MASINTYRQYIIMRAADARRIGRAVVAWGCLTLLAMNLLVGAALPAQEAVAGIGEIVICTSAGISVLDQSGTPVTDQRRTHDTFCVFCLPLMQGGLIGADAFDLAAPLFPSAAGTFPATARVDVVARLCGAASPRAPPFV